MPGIGTVVNALAILAGGTVGLLAKKGFPERFRTIIFDAVGCAVFLIGLTGVLTNCLYITEEGGIGSRYIMELLLSLVLGAIVGELLRIDRLFDKAGDKLKSLFKNGDSGLGTGFANTTVLFCAGAMAILGSIQDGVLRDPSTLFTKAVLDGISGMIFATVYGYGVLFSAGSVLVYQGLITLLSTFIAPYLGDVLVCQMSMVGNAVVMLISFGMWGFKEIKIANLIPATFMPVLFLAVKSMFSL